MTKKLLLLAAAAFLIPQLAFAGNVSYSTSGSFSSSSTATSSNMPVGFVSSGPQTVPAGPGLLGSFTIGDFSKCGTVPKCTTTDTLTITIVQTAPTGGSGNLTATVTGQVAFNSKTGQVSWNFTGATVTIGGVTYDALDGSGTKKLPGEIDAFIFGPALVPEPNAQLLLGLGGLGLIGLATVSRKMINT